MKPKPMPPAEVDPVADPREIEAVLDEGPQRVAAPETTPETQELQEWDTPPDSTGGVAEKTPGDDESTVAERLVNSGLSQADRDQRLAAVDPDFEP